MENKINNEELIQETEVVEEESLKFDKQKAKKIIKKVLIGTGVAAIIGGVIATMKHSKNLEAESLQDFEDEHLKSLESGEDNSVDPENSESN